MIEQIIIMFLGIVIMLLPTVMFIVDWKEHKREKKAWDAERTDLLNRIAAKSIGEYERLKSGHMPRDEPQPLTAHEKAIKKWHNAGKQGGIAKQP